MDPVLTPQLRRYCDTAASTCETDYPMVFNIDTRRTHVVGNVLVAKEASELVDSDDIA